MKEIVVSKKYCLEYIMDKLNDFMVGYNKVIEDAKYHHNTKYHRTSSIIEYGLLDLNAINSFGIKHYSDETLQLMSDTSSHINGSDGISLSIPGMGDLSNKEDEYDPFNEKQVDILIDSSIKAYRNSTNYGNEFISFQNISRDKFKAIDIRLLKLIKVSILSKKVDDEFIQNIVRKYNSLRNIAIYMQYYNLDIPLREMSKEESIIDIVALGSSEELKLR